MQLDYQPGKQTFTLTVPRSEHELVTKLVKEQGMDFSETASTSATAALFTREPYAAATFRKHATLRALEAMRPMLAEIDASWKEESNAHIRCPADMELWPFQKANIEYALRRRNTLVADQPGLGKTPTAICFANEIRAERVLVVCPANIRLQWLYRIQEWSTLPAPFLMYPILKGRGGVHPNAQWTVVSYDLARTEAIGKALAANTYDLLILDEIHYLKSIDAERTQAIFGDHTGSFRKPVRDWDTNKIIDYDVWFEALASRCGAILGLSGTPLPNRPREAYTVARGLCFDSIDFMSEDNFNERFNPRARLTKTRKDGTEYTYTREEVGRAGELQNRMRANFMTRHMKRQVMKQLKMPLYDLVHVLETSQIKAALAAESLLDIDPEMLEGADAVVLGNWAIVRHQIGLAIAPQVCDYAAMALDGGEDKLVIGAWHKDVLDIYQQRLAKFGVLRIDGATSAGKKAEHVTTFQTDPRVRVMIGNTLSLGTGTDGLQHVCSHLLLGEPDPVPGNNEQFVDRLDRGGQTRTVLADFFVAPGSILERILASALRKKQDTHQALDYVF